MAKRPDTIETVMFAALRRGESNARVHAQIIKRFPQATLGVETVNWYRNRLREDGERIPTNKDAKG